ncbi:hypothetical protein AVEN_73014-1 [Araneus ventricosus]|uniref:Uncharacterized protein n=1 Tax=Araneus ventricosus TaxID=182803 RepID=A0A4Y2U211_ARAVE|nr:hypothetical protein AVEN_148285-1 [Araneus ventricosus]GBO06600.1 hypothetical protein AVEN_73014-1 [Araneus ventricosus]
MKSTRTRAKNDAIGSRRSEPIILSDFLPQFYQGRVWKYAVGFSVFLAHISVGRSSLGSGCEPGIFQLRSQGLTTKPSRHWKWKRIYTIWVN